MLLMIYLNFMDTREGGMLDKPENSDEVQRLKLILDQKFEDAGKRPDRYTTETIPIDADDHEEQE